MSRETSIRWGVYVHDPEGDMGYGEIIGPFFDDEKAESKAEAIRKASGDRFECIVLPILAGGTSAQRATDVMDLRVAR